MKNRAYWIDNLRSFVIILVVAHHAALAYLTYAYFNKDAYNFSTHPMVDTQRWMGMHWFTYFIDIVLMVLMFFISGLFVVSSLKKKGAKAFLRDRFNRLFVTFMIGVTIFMLIALYPSYIVARGDFNIINYIIDFFTTETWPVGPPWFVWVLFMFNLIFTLVFKYIKGLLDKLSNVLLFFKDKPILFFVTLLFLTWIIYVPMRFTFGPFTWWVDSGPFKFQESRLLMYFGYFLLGTVFGNIPQEKGIFSDTFSFMKKWKLWIALCLFMYLILLLIDNPSIGNPLKQFCEAYKLNGTIGDSIYCTIYVSTCVLGCIAFLTLFKNLVNNSNKFWVSFASTSFFIYLVHYIFIIWGQYMLLQSPIHAILKFLIVFLVAISISWSLGFLIHKNYWLSRYF